MFTGIIEKVTPILDVINDKNNLNIFLKNPFKKLKINDSISHNGACLTVNKIFKNKYRVTVTKESLEKTNLKNIKIGEYINIERSLKLKNRLNGHMVQGHVDLVAFIENKIEKNGSWIYKVNFYNNYYKKLYKNLVVEKCSITINGVSLTAINTSKYGFFSVNIIPYTYENTNFKYMNVGQDVNIEFDIIGKYISKLLNEYYNIH